MTKILKIKLSANAKFRIQAVLTLSFERASESLGL